MRQYLLPPSDDILRGVEEVVDNLLQTTNDALANAVATNAAAMKTFPRGLTANEKLLAAIKKYLKHNNMSDRRINYLYNITQRIAKVEKMRIDDLLYLFET